MSGHSKWSKVKHQKAVTDSTKAGAFTKAARALSVAVKEGGRIIDPNRNFKLRLAIEKAKEVNMPKDTIERAILKGKGDDTESMASYVYEAYGPDGVALLIEAMSENNKRTVASIKNILDHHEGVLASPGAVSFQFTKKGVVVITRTEGISDEEILAHALEVGCDDVSFYDDSIELFTPTDGFFSIEQAIRSKGYTIDNSEIIFHPTMPRVVSEEVKKKIETLTHLLLDLDDVQKVFSSIS